MLEVGREVPLPDCRNTSKQCGEGEEGKGRGKDDNGKEDAEDESVSSSSSFKSKSKSKSLFAYGDALVAALTDSKIVVPAVIAAVTGAVVAGLILYVEHQRLQQHYDRDWDHHREEEEVEKKYRIDRSEK